MLGTVTHSAMLADMTSPRCPVAGAGGATRTVDHPALNHPDPRQDNRGYNRTASELIIFTVGAGIGNRPHSVAVAITIRRGFLVKQPSTILTRVSEETA